MARLLHAPSITRLLTLVPWLLSNVPCWPLNAAALCVHTSGLATAGTRGSMHAKDSAASMLLHPPPLAAMSATPLIRPNGFV